MNNKEMWELDSAREKENVLIRKLAAELNRNPNNEKPYEGYNRPCEFSTNLKETKT